MQPLYYFLFWCVISTLLDEFFHGEWLVSDTSKQRSFLMTAFLTSVDYSIWTKPVQFFCSFRIICFMAPARQSAASSRLTRRNTSIQLLLTTCTLTSCSDFIDIISTDFLTADSSNSKSPTIPVETQPTMFSVLPFIFTLVSENRALFDASRENEKI